MIHYANVLYIYISDTLCLCFVYILVIHYAYVLCFVYILVIHYANVLYIY